MKVEKEIKEITGKMIARELKKLSKKTLKKIYDDEYQFYMNELHQNNHIYLSDGVDKNSEAKPLIMIDALLLHFSHIFITYDEFSDSAIEKIVDFAYNM